MRRRLRRLVAHVRKHPREWIVAAQIAVGWALLTWALADATVWLARGLGADPGGLQAAVWAGSAGLLVLGLVGWRLLAQVFGYGPVLLDELDRKR